MASADGLFGLSRVRTMAVYEAQQAGSADLRPVRRMANSTAAYGPIRGLVKSATASIWLHHPQVPQRIRLVPIRDHKLMPPDIVCQPAAHEENLEHACGEGFMRHWPTAT